MKKEFVSILAILLGILIIALPLLGVVAVGAIFGLSILFIAIFLLVLGVYSMDYNKWGSILYLIVGLAVLILSIGIIFSPDLFATVAKYLFYLAGLILIIIGVISLINNNYYGSKYGFTTGIVGILIGVIYIAIGSFIANPTILGYLIGIWLIITGVLRLIDR